MNNIYKVHDIVLEVLQESEESRYDDFVLINCVYAKICPFINKWSFSKVMLSHRQLNLPYTISITRARQKIQEKHKELRPPQDIYIKRINKTKEFIEYARS